MKNNLNIIVLTLALLISFSLPSFAAKPAKNQWTKLVSETCKTETNTCSNNISDTGNTDQTKSCISCCASDESIGSDESCFNYCTCECSLKANPKGANTHKLCSNRKKKKK